MAYIPKLEDLDNSNQKSVNESFYTPTLQELDEIDKNLKKGSPHDSLIERLASNPVTQFTLGTGDALRNAMANLANILPGVNIQKAQSGQGLPYDIGKITGDIGSFIGGGELLGAGRAASEAIPYIGQLAKALGGQGLSGVARRGIGSAAYGAIENPEKRGEGALTGAGFSLAADMLPGALKIPAKISEKINPIKYTKQLSEMISKGYKTAEEKASNLYDKVTNKYGESLLTITPKDYFGFDKKVTKYFTPDVKKVYEDFLAEPTFGTAHKLQSQLGKDWARVRGNPSKENTSQTLRNAREAVKKKIESFLNLDKDAADTYKLATNVSKNEVYPYLANKTLEKISEGVKEYIKPEQLLSAIKKGKEKILYKKNKQPVVAIREDHPLSSHLEELQKKLGRGKIIGDISSIVGGGLLGNRLGNIGGIPGELLGGIAGKMLGPTVLDMAGNPIIQKGFSKLKSPYDYLSKALIGSVLSE